MALVGQAVGRASLQYWNGSAWTDIQTPSGANAVLDLEITDSLYNPVALTASLINRPTDPRSGTAGSTTGNLTGVLTEFMKLRCIDAYSKQVLFHGWIYDIEENYNIQRGGFLVIHAYDSLAEMRDYKTDSMLKIDTSESTHNSRSELIAELIKRTTKDNIATSDTDQFEASTQTFAGNTLGEIFPKDAGKTVLKAIKHLASTEPVDASSLAHLFGHDFYLAPQFTSTATSATQTSMLNYFKRASRPKASGSDMDTFGMKIQFPVASSQVESGQTRNMLPDYDFQRDRASVYSDAHIKFVDRGGKGKDASGDSPSQGQSRKTLPLQMARLNMTAISGAFNWANSPLAGDLTVNGQYVYTDVKDGHYHAFTASKIHVDSDGANVTFVQDREPGADWLLRIGSAYDSIEAELNTSANDSHKLGWFRFANVPENDDSNTTPGGKMRISGLSLSDTSTVTVTTTTKHFLQAGDRVMLTGLNLSTGGGAIRKNAQTYKKNGGARVISREGQLGTLAYRANTNVTNALAHAFSDELIQVDKDHGFKTSNYGSFAYLENEIVEMKEIFSSIPADGNMPTNNFNLSDTATSLASLDHMDVIEVVRASLSTTQVEHTIMNGAANTNAGRHSPVPIFAAPRAANLYAQEGGVGGIFKHNLFRVERVISDTQFTFKVDASTITWAGGLLTVGFLDGAIDDAVDTVQFNIDVNDGSQDRVVRPHLYVGQIITLGSEEMLVTAVGSAGSSGDKYETQVTVTRAYNSTTIASHIDNLAVTTMVAHVIPVVGRVQYQTTTSSVSNGQDFIIISDQAANMPTTGSFRLYGMQSGDYATFASGTTAVSHRETFGLNRPKFMTVNPMEKLPDSVRQVVAGALGDGTFTETRGGTMRINNSAYQYIDGTAYSVSGGTVVTTRNTANDTALNPLNYGLRVGMVAWKLTSATVSTMAAYGYVSAVNATTFTVTLNTGSFSADDKFRIFIPLRPGHLVQLKNKLLKIDTTSTNTFSDAQDDFIVTQLKYKESPAVQQTSVSVIQQDASEVRAPKNVFQAVESETDDNAYSSFEDTLINPATASTDIDILPGTRTLSTDGPVTDTDGATIEGKLFDKGEAISWTKGTLRVDGDEYQIPAGSSTDGGDLDATTLTVGATMATVNEYGILNMETVKTATSFPNTEYVLYADLRQSKFLFTSVTNFENFVKDKGSKLIIGYARAATDAASNNVGAESTFDWRISHESNNAMSIKTSQYVGQGYGSGNNIAPVLAFDGDTNTGIYSAADGRINFTSNGSNYGEFGQGDYSYLRHFLPIINDTYDLGHSSYKWDDIYATNDTIQTSDERLKEDITSIDLGLEFLEQLNPVTYKWKQKPVEQTNITGEKYTKPDQKHYGLIAQEVMEVLKKYNINSTDDFGGLTGSADSTYGARYKEFIAIIIKGIQELATRVKALENGS